MNGGEGLPRVLVLHNRYRAQAGEERAAAELAELLDERGHTVRLMERSSESLGRASAAAALVRGGRNPGEVAEAVREIGAEIVHAHNTLPLFGARALAAARGAGARTVVHLHNYRLVCAIGISYRDGAPCARCQGRRTTPGIRLRCRGNLPEALAYGIGIARNQPRMLEAVDRFVLTTEGSRRWLAQLGISPPDYDVFPNFLPDSAFAGGSRADAGEYALYAGRLAEEKGVDTAIEACKRAGVPLAIAGQGPDEVRLRGLAAHSGHEIRFLGQLGAERLAEAKARAGIVLAPSRWHEPNPYAVSEAMAAGLPVLASDVGGLPEMVGPESSLPPTDHDAWAQTLRELWGDRKLLRERGEAALAAAREKFGADAYYERLMACYRTALS
jgi:glycosyltransferase involved in cell wall biosynthesis